MPQLDGPEVARRFRASEDATKERLPIVALTANAFSSDRQTCLDAGMDAYLSKPARVAELSEVLELYR